VPEAEFYTCLAEWFASDSGQFLSTNIKLDEQTGKIEGWREFVTPIKSDNVYRDGPIYLRDLRSLLGKYGFVDESFAYSSDMLTMELYVMLTRETAIILGSSALVTLFVVIIITGEYRLGLIVTGSVILTNYFLVALIPLLGLTFNNVVVVYLITSIGLSVVYSTQISHTFLLVQIDNRIESKKQKNIRARVALSRMVMSVLHSAVINLIAVTILSIGHKSYFFSVLTKLWLSIALISLFNAFFFLPVVLSFVGPTPDHEEKDRERAVGIRRSLKWFNSDQLIALQNQHGSLGSILDVPVGIEQSGGPTDINPNSSRNLLSAKAGESDLILVFNHNDPVNYSSKEIRDDEVDVEMRAVRQID